jgi:ParB-like chromosome segregation protein Spo0J
MAKSFGSALDAIIGKKPSQQMGLRLSEVVKIAPTLLKANKRNQEFFKQESTQYFERLRSDIRERGIIVPLIAKDDNTLLAGHNRLLVALEVGLAEVPVQYVEDELSEQQEREFLIKDNLLRRQLSAAEWIETYRKLYPNFDERIFEEHRGGNRFAKTKGETFPFDTQEPSQASERREAEPLTAKKIAQDTGQSAETVKKHLQKFKQTHRAQQGSPTADLALNTATSTVPEPLSKQQALKELERIFAASERSAEETQTPSQTRLQELRQAVLSVVQRMR